MRLKLAIVLFSYISKWCSGFVAPPSSIRTPQKVLRRAAITMDDEVPRPGIKRELTTRDEYLATRFFKLSTSGHDLTPMTLAEITEEDQKEDREGLPLSAADAKGLFVCAVGGLPIFASGDRIKAASCGPASLFFSAPCDPEHVRIDPTTGRVYCVRSGKLVAILENDRYRVTCGPGTSLRFLGLDKPIPLSSRPESIWGSEDQYTYTNFSRTYN